MEGYIAMGRFTQRRENRPRLMTVLLVKHIGSKVRNVAFSHPTTFERTMLFYTSGFHRNVSIGWVRTG